MPRDTPIGGGTKLNLTKTTDTDVLKVIVINLQKRVKVGVETLLIKEVLECVNQ